jgi:hypothetical protein
MTTPAEINDKVQQFSSVNNDEALETLFFKYCNDSTEMMSYKTLQTIPTIKEMLETGDLLISELDTIWKSLVVDKKKEDAIDSKGFIQLYKSIDDMFEEVDDDDDENQTSTTTVWGEKVNENQNVIWEKNEVESTINNDDDEEEEEEELKKVFATLTGSTTTEISFSQLWQWDEVSSLVNDGMLDANEFAMLWNKAGGNESGLDIYGFIKFNIALDELFDFENDDNENDNNDEITDNNDENNGTTSRLLPMITEQDLPSGVLFTLISKSNLVGKTELSRWGELMDMLTLGDITESELDVLFDSIPKATGTTDMLDEDGFVLFYNGIDNMFEDDDDDDDKDNVSGDRKESSNSMGKEGEKKMVVSDEKELKEELLELIDDITKASAEDGRLMCGLDSSELEQERVLEVVSELERESYNRVVSYESGGVGASKEELVGAWELIYSSSSTMKYNEGLSGLAGGLTRFGGVQQTLMATKYLSDVEYTEQVIGKMGGKSFEVKVTGDWELVEKKGRLDIRLGGMIYLLAVTPDKVIYGPRSDKADHWKSLGPMNLLVLSYLDEDLRIMRGHTSTDTLFIWRRKS